MLPDCPKAIPSASVSFNYSVSIHPSIIHSLPHISAPQAKDFFLHVESDKLSSGKKNTRVERRKGERGEGQVGGSRRGMAGDEKHQGEFQYLRKTISHLASETTSHN